MRKVFNRDNIAESSLVANLNVYEYNISACGCMLYKIVNGELFLLLIAYENPAWPKLDDFGGKVDIEDATPDHTMWREVAEETNGIITMESLAQYENRRRFYCKSAKYQCTLIEVPADYAIDTGVFGDIEGNGHARSIDWYEFSATRGRLAQRLAYCGELTAHLELITKKING